MTELDARRIGKLVRKIRKEELSQSQEQFAEGIDRSVRTVSNIERGTVVPTMDTLIRISQYTGKTILYFFDTSEG